MIIRKTLGSLVKLRQALVESHQNAHSHEGQPGNIGDLVIGIQLTHSGRYSKPNDKKRMEPMLGYDHPLLNPRLGLEKVSGRVMSDDALDELVECYVQAAGLAREAGFDFVDVKLCHGYLGHELLSAFERPGRYGGSLENRTRFPREIIHGILTRVPGLGIGVRMSVFDFVPFKPGPDAVGIPDWGPFAEGQYPFAFGGDGSGLGFDLREPIELIHMLEDLGVRLICLTAGSPYYNPHIQRPAYFPPSDGYLPPEDPLVGVARQIEAVRQVKAACPGAAIVGSAYTALQDYLPNVAQAVVRSGAADFVGLGRMMLSYPEFPADMLAGQGMQRKRICRTFSDCTTAPRNGLVSGCYLLDAYYKDSPEAEELDGFKKK
jgi:2,4-dienoyl-CoA reductase-like NADH-dependent reductase (Old Yellow Enzyme family)